MTAGDWEEWEQWMKSHHIKLAKTTEDQPEPERRISNAGGSKNQKK